MEPGTGLILLLVLCLSCLTVMYGKWWREKSQFPPGPTPLPFLGNLLQIRISDMVNSLMKLHKQYGQMYTVYLGPQRYVVLCGYERMKEALIDRGREFSGRGNYPLFYNFTKGDGIGFSNGAKWKQLRRFSMTVMGNLGMGKRSIEERIQEEVGFLIKDLKETKMSHINLEFRMSRSVSNIISIIVFGKRFDYDNEEFLALVSCVQTIFHLMSSTSGMIYHIYPDIMDHLPGPHHQIFKYFQTIKIFILETAKKKQEMLDPNCPRDYIDYFFIKMEQEKNNPETFFNWDTLVMSSLILYFGGTESISTTLRFALLYMMKHPKIQEKVQEEIDRVIGRHHIPSFAHKSKMPYTQAVLHEVQRFGDVIPLAITHMLTQDTTLGGYNFKKGTLFIPLMTSVHFDSTQYKNPEVFDPAHFLDENGCFKTNPAFMPFSAGKRFCLGANLAIMEMFIYFTYILQNFKLMPLNSPEEVNDIPIGIFFAKFPQPFKVSFVPR